VKEVNLEIVKRIALPQGPNAVMLLAAWIVKKLVPAAEIILANSTFIFPQEIIPIGVGWGRFHGRHRTGMKKEKDEAQLVVDYFHLDDDPIVHILLNSDCLRSENDPLSIAGLITAFYEAGMNDEQIRKQVFGMFDAIETAQNNFISKLQKVHQWFVVNGKPFGVGLIHTDDDNLRNHVGSAIELLVQVKSSGHSSIISMNKSIQARPN